MDRRNFILGSGALAAAATGKTAVAGERAGAFEFASPVSVGVKADGVWHRDRGEVTIGRDGTIRLTAAKASWIRITWAVSFEMLKWDFLVVDIFRKYAPAMTDSVIEGDWGFYDRTRTSAEICLDYYRRTAELAGDMVVNCCNIFSHLSAGLFPSFRISDDTSGSDWSRTTRYCVNALAFRGMQHRALYSVDPECCPITEKIPWAKTREWLRLITYSGTSLFVSIQHESYTNAVRDEVAAVFALAAEPHPVMRASSGLTARELGSGGFVTAAKESHAVTTDPAVNSRNRLPPRAYAMPLASVLAALADGAGAEDAVCDFAERGQEVQLRIPNDATQPGAVLSNASQVLTFGNGVMTGDRSPVACPNEGGRTLQDGWKFTGCWFVGCWLLKRAERLLKAVERAERMARGRLCVLSRTRGGSAFYHLQYRKDTKLHQRYVSRDEAPAYERLSERTIDFRRPLSV